MRFPSVHLFVDVDPSLRRQLSQRLCDAGREVVWVESASALAAALPSLRVLGCGALADIDYAPATELSLVQVFGAGVDHLPLDRLPPRVQVANARGIHGGEIRDHALAMMFSFARELPRLAEAQQRRHWAPFAASSVVDKTLGVLGLGCIGQSIAAAGGALGMNVLGTRWSRAPVDDVEVLEPRWTRRVLRESDYVVVCLPLTAATRGLLDREHLSELSPEAVLIVISRGGIVDERALCEMLVAGRLRGAALDVFDEEPLPTESALWTVPNLVVSPHMSGHAHDYFERALTLLAANLERLEADLPLLTPVDRERGY